MSKYIIRGKFQRLTSFLLGLLSLTSCSGSYAPTNKGALILTNENSSFTLIKDYTVKNGYSELGNPTSSKILKTGSITLKDAYLNGYFDEGFIHANGELISKYGETLCFYTEYERTYNKETYDILYSNFYKLDITNASEIDGKNEVSMFGDKYPVYLQSEIIRYISEADKIQIGFYWAGETIYLDADWTWEALPCRDCFSKEYDGYIFGANNSKCFKTNITDMPIKEYRLVSTEEVVKRDFVVDVPNIKNSMF